MAGVEGWASSTGWRSGVPGAARRVEEAAGAGGRGRHGGRVGAVAAVAAEAGREGPAAKATDWSTKERRYACHLSTKMGYHAAAGPEGGSTTWTDHRTWWDGGRPRAKGVCMSLNWNHAISGSRRTRSWRRRVKPESSLEGSALAVVGKGWLWSTSHSKSRAMLHSPRSGGTGRSDRWSRIHWTKPESTEPIRWWRAAAGWAASSDWEERRQVSASMATRGARL